MTYVVFVVFFKQKTAYEMLRSLVGSEMCIRDRINMEHTAFDQGLAQALADHLNSPCYTITELHADNLYQTVRQEMVQHPNLHHATELRTP